MAVDVQIPALGESVTEGVIVRWMKQNGERVNADEPLFELETDKASVEIPAPSAGVITIIPAEGATVHVGDVVARIDGADGAAKASPPPQPAADRAAKTAAPSQPPPAKPAIPAAPAAAKPPEPAPVSAPAQSPAAASEEQQL